MISRSILPFLALVPSLSLPPAATAQAPTSIPSRVVKVVEFDDRGRTYRVELETGKVVYTESSNVIPPTPDPTPAPQPTPTPNPPAPVVVTGKPAWACLFVNPAKADAQWLDSDEIREAAAARGIQFRGFRSPEPEVDELGFRKLVRANEVPCVVIQSADGKVLLSRKVTSAEDVVRAMGEVK